MSSFNPMIAGTLAGFIEASFMHPLDTLKTQYQSNKVLPYNLTSKSLPSIFRHYYKGFAPVCTMMMPKVAIQFTGLAYMKQQLQQTACPEAAIPVAAGLATGLVQAVLILTPFELVKVRQQTDGVAKSQLSVIKSIWRTEGLLGYYNGLTATVARQSWGLVVKFSGYEFFRKKLDNYHNINTAEEQSSSPVLHHALSGFLANVIVAVLNSPPDVVKTHMQVKSTTSLSLRTVLQHIVQNYGIAGFFKGTTYRILRIAPGGAIQFGTYGYLTSLLETKRSKNQL